MGGDKNFNKKKKKEEISSHSQDGALLQTLNSLMLLDFGNNHNNWKFNLKKV